MLSRAYYDYVYHNVWSRLTEYEQTEADLNGVIYTLNLGLLDPNPIHLENPTGSTYPDWKYVI